MNREIIVKYSFDKKECLHLLSILTFLHWEEYFPRGNGALQAKVLSLPQTYKAAKPETAGTLITPGGCWLWNTQRGDHWEKVNTERLWLPPLHHTQCYEASTEQGDIVSTLTVVHSITWIALCAVLSPALLLSHICSNVWFCGQKCISSVGF